MRSCRRLCVTKSRGRSSVPFQPFEGMGRGSVDRFDLIADRIRCDNRDVHPPPARASGLEGSWEVVELN